MEKTVQDFLNSLESGKREDFLGDFSRREANMEVAEILTDSKVRAALEDYDDINDRVDSGERIDSYPTKEEMDYWLEHPGNKESKEIETRMRKFICTKHGIEEKDFRDAISARLDAFFSGKEDSSAKDY